MLQNNIRLIQVSVVQYEIFHGTYRRIINCPSCLSLKRLRPIYLSTVCSILFHNKFYSYSFNLGTIRKSIWSSCTRNCLPLMVKPVHELRDINQIKEQLSHLLQLESNINDELDAILSQKNDLEHNTVTMLEKTKQ